MDENTNNQFEQSNQQAPQQPSQPSVPPVGGEDDFGDGGGSKKWIGWLSLVVLVAAVLYFFGFWSWVSNLIPKAGDQVIDENPSEELSEELVEEEAPGSVELIPIEKGKVSLVVSAENLSGATVTKGEPRPNVEIRKVYLHNPFKDSWLLIYEGSRPIDLNLLGATGENHELIATALAAVVYDKMRVEFADLVSIDQKGEQTVARTKTVELEGAIGVEPGISQEINIWFNISDPNEPKLEAVL